MLVLCRIALIVSLSFILVQGNRQQSRKWIPDGKSSRNTDFSILIINETFPGHLLSINSEESFEWLHSLKPAFVDRCDQNEVWYSCLPPYPITCENLYKPYVPNSFGRCLKGCECARGYVRLIAESCCVPVDKCPSMKTYLQNEILCITLNFSSNRNSAEVPSE